MDKYTVYEVANILQTSHTTIYNKMNNKEIYKELRNFIINQGKNRYISKEGIEILKKHVPPKEDSSKVESRKNKENNVSIPTPLNNTNKETFQEIDNKLIVEFKERIESLENQLSVKDKQIESLLRQNENSQVLLKQQQDKIFFLESGEKQKASSKPWWKIWMQERF
jgi:uncharacterized coiled-coil protein SlyX